MAADANGDVVDAAPDVAAAPPPPKYSSGPDMGLGMGRAMLAMQLFEKGKKLYADCEADPNPEEAYERTHRLMADECLKLAQSHGGIYNKAAQFVASLQGGAGDKGIPKAYIEALKVVTDKAPFKPSPRWMSASKRSSGARAPRRFSPPSMRTQSPRRPSRRSIAR